MEEVFDMKVEVTKEAEARLRALDGVIGDGCLKLAYDSEGCGCAVDGVAQLWIVSAPGEHDEPLRTEPRPIWYDRRQAWYFSETLKLDYRPSGGTFVLSSKEQIYNAATPLIDKR